MRNFSNINTVKLDALYDLANLNGIPVDEDCPPSIVSMSVKLPSGTKIVSLSKAENGDSTKLERFAHEMGHCMTDSFYAGYSPFELRAKHEKSANEWAVKQLIPFDSLCNAVKNGYRESWELAEYFDVSATFIQKAIELHASEGNTVPTKFYKEY